MQFLPQQQYGAFPPQCQQCSLSPGYNNFSPGYSQPQQPYLPLGASYPQQNFNNPFQQQQYYYPQQQFPSYPQQQFPSYPQQQFPFYPQQQQQFPFYPQQQQQFPFYPQQQQAAFYPQQQWSNLPQSNLGPNAYGFQQYWPQQQQRVYEDAPKVLSPVNHKKPKAKTYYERYYL